MYRRAYDELVASARPPSSGGAAAPPKHELHFLHSSGYAADMTPLVLNREVSLDYASA
jgi:hypothetical protein